MQTLTEIVFSNINEIGPVFTDVDVANLLDEATSASRYAMVKRAMAAKEIIRIRRGLYLIAAKYRTLPIDLYSIASRIYAPSYISLESALSLHGLIPEEVKSITSCVFKRSRSFETPLGIFNYQRSCFNDLLEIAHVEVNRFYSYLLASPIRALADLVYESRGRVSSMDSILESLRIDYDDLKSAVPLESIDGMQKKSMPKRVAHFLEVLKQELYP
jgi:predicted transcriptional regulator of viral defense system